MKLILRWSAFRPDPARERLDRLRQVLRAASAAHYYRRRAVSVPPPGRSSSAALLLDRLRELPVVPAGDFLRNPEDFYNWETPRKRRLKPKPRRLESPLPGLGRTAILEPGFEESPSRRVLAGREETGLADFRPESLAGPAPHLLALAGAALAGRVALPTLRYAVVAFTGLKHGCLREEDRDLLWDAFGLPVFEQFRGFGRELLAWECEAHDGLHVAGRNAIFEAAPGAPLIVTCLDSPDYALARLATDMTARLDTTPCPCGEASPRLLDLTACGRSRPTAAPPATFATACPA